MGFIGVPELSLEGSVGLYATFQGTDISVAKPTRPTTTSSFRPLSTTALGRVHAAHSGALLLLG